MHHLYQMRYFKFRNPAITYILHSIACDLCVQLSCKFSLIIAKRLDYARNQITTNNSSSTEMNMDTVDPHTCFDQHIFSASIGTDAVLAELLVITTRWYNTLILIEKQVSFLLDLIQHDLDYWASTYIIWHAYWSKCQLKNAGLRHEVWQSPEWVI